jgi:hypothetical protein
LETKLTAIHQMQCKPVLLIINTKNVLTDTVSQGKNVYNALKLDEMNVKETQEIFK